MAENTNTVKSAVIYLAPFYLLIFLFRPVYINFIVSNFSKIEYVDDLGLKPLGVHIILLLAYGVLSFRLNMGTLKLIAPGSRTWWVLNWFIDLIFLPIGVYIMVIKNNSKAFANISSLEDMFTMFLLLGGKHLLLSLWVVIWAAKKSRTNT